MPSIHSFACPSCFGQQTHVVNSRALPNGERKRRYKCLDCDYTFTSVEVPFGEVRSNSASDALRKVILHEVSTEVLLAELGRRIDERTR